MTGRPHDAPVDLQRAVQDLRIELAVLNDKVAAAVGLNPRDLDVLDVVTHDGPCTPGHLAARTAVPAATLTGVLVRLARDGWITRTLDPDDRRSARIAAAARVDELATPYAPADLEVADLLAGLDPQEQRVIAAFLASVAAVARRTGDRL